MQFPKARAFGYREVSTHHCSSLSPSSRSSRSWPRAARATIQQDLCIEPDIEYPVPCEDDDDGGARWRVCHPWRTGVLILPEAIKPSSSQSARRPAPDLPLGQLLNAPMRPGELVWIGVRPARRAPIETRTTATLVAGRGIEGDHYDTRRDGPRQATLIAAEDIEAIASFLGQTTIPPELLRRNLVTRGLNLLALKGRRFRVGSTLLEGTGECCAVQPDGKPAGARRLQCRSRAWRNYRPDY